MNSRSGSASGTHQRPQSQKEDKGVQCEIPSPSSAENLLDIHRTVLLFYNLIQRYVEDNEFPFVEEWVGPVPDDLVEPGDQNEMETRGDKRRKFQEQEEAYLLGLRAQLRELMALKPSGGETAREIEQKKVAKLKEVSTTQKAIFIRRVRRVQQEAESETDLRHTLFVEWNKKSLENPDAEPLLRVEEHTLFDSIRALLGKTFLFLNNAVEHKEKLPRPQNILWGGTTQKNLLGLGEGQDLDCIAWPRDAESIYLTHEDLLQFATKNKQAFRSSDGTELPKREKCCARCGGLMQSHSFSGSSRAGSSDALQLSRHQSSGSVSMVSVATPLTRGISVADGQPLVVIGGANSEEQAANTPMTDSVSKDDLSVSGAPPDRRRSTLPMPATPPTGAHEPLQSFSQLSTAIPGTQLRVSEGEPEIPPDPAAVRVRKLSSSSSMASHLSGQSHVSSASAGAISESPPFLSTGSHPKLSVGREASNSPGSQGASSVGVSPTMAEYAMMQSLGDVDSSQRRPSGSRLTSSRFSLTSPLRSQAPAGCGSAGTSPRRESESEGSPSIVREASPMMLPYDPHSDPGIPQAISRRDSLRTPRNFQPPTLDDAVSLGSVSAGPFSAQGWRETSLVSTANQSQTLTASQQMEGVTSLSREGSHRKSGSEAVLSSLISSESQRRHSLSQSLPSMERRSSAASSGASSAPSPLVPRRPSGPVSSLHPPPIPSTSPPAIAPETITGEAPQPLPLNESEVVEPAEKVGPIPAADAEVGPTPTTPGTAGTLNEQPLSEEAPPEIANTVEKRECDGSEPAPLKVLVDMENEEEARPGTNNTDGNEVSVTPGHQPATAAPTPTSSVPTPGSTCSVSVPVAAVVDPSAAGPQVVAVETVLTSVASPLVGMRRMSVGASTEGHASPQSLSQTAEMEMELALRQSPPPMIPSPRPAEEAATGDVGDGRSPANEELQATVGSLVGGNEVAPHEGEGEGAQQPSVVPAVPAVEKDAAPLVEEKETQQQLSQSAEEQSNTTPVAEPVPTTTQEDRSVVTEESPSGEREKQTESPEESLEESVTGHEELAALAEVGGADATLAVENTAVPTLAEASPPVEEKNSGEEPQIPATAPTTTDEAGETGTGSSDGDGSGDRFSNIKSAIISKVETTAFVPESVSNDGLGSRQGSSTASSRQGSAKASTASCVDLGSRQGSAKSSTAGSRQGSAKASSSGDLGSRQGSAKGPKEMPIPSRKGKGKHPPRGPPKAKGTSVTGDEGGALEGWTAGGAKHGTDGLHLIDPAMEAQKEIEALEQIRIGGAKQRAPVPKRSGVKAPAKKSSAPSGKKPKAKGKVTAKEQPTKQPETTESPEESSTDEEAEERLTTPLQRPAPEERTASASSTSLRVLNAFCKTKEEEARLMLALSTSEQLMVDAMIRSRQVKPPKEGKRKTAPGAAQTTTIHTSGLEGKLTLNRPGSFCLTRSEAKEDEKLPPTATVEGILSEPSQGQVGNVITFGEQTIHKAYGPGDGNAPAGSASKGYTPHALKQKPHLLVRSSLPAIGESAAGEEEANVVSSRPTATPELVSFARVQGGPTGYFPLRPSTWESGQRIRRAGTSMSSADSSSRQRLSSTSHPPRPSSTVPPSLKSPEGDGDDERTQTVVDALRRRNPLRTERQFVYLKKGNASAQ